MSDTVVAALIGVGGLVSGSLLTLCGLWLQSLLQYKRENRQHLARKREELYLLACDVLMLHDKYYSAPTGIIDEECKTKFNEIQARMMLYASKEVYDAYYKLDGEIIHSYDKIRTKSKIEEISNKNADKVEVFATKMRKELGIKGVLKCQQKDSKK